MTTHVHIKETSLPLYWRAVYSDGSILNQYNDDGSKNRYDDLPREGLKQFMLLTPSGDPIVVINLDKNKKLIWRMRVEVKIAKGTSRRVHLVGWQEYRRRFFGLIKTKSQVICAIYPDWHVEVIDGFKEKHPWFYPVKLREAERL